MKALHFLSKSQTIRVKKRRQTSKGKKIREKGTERERERKAGTITRRGKKKRRKKYREKKRNKSREED